jgi:hypothetical protein
MRLTAPILQAAYDFLRTTLPFRRWNLPPGEDVDFKVSKDHSAIGTYQIRDDHTITISGARVCHTATLIVTMAHEMVHLAQVEDGSATRTMHNAAFRRMAKLVCKHHGFDPKEF